MAVDFGESIADPAEHLGRLRQILNYLEEERRGKRLSSAVRGHDEVARRLVRVKPRSHQPSALGCRVEMGDVLRSGGVERNIDGAQARRHSGHTGWRSRANACLRSILVTLSPTVGSRGVGVPFVVQIQDDELRHAPTPRH